MDGHGVPADHHDLRGLRLQEPPGDRQERTHVQAGVEGTGQGQAGLVQRPHPVAPRRLRQPRAVGVVRERERDREQREGERRALPHHGHGHAERQVPGPVGRVQPEVLPHHVSERAPFDERDDESCQAVIDHEARRHGQRRGEPGLRMGHRRGTGRPEQRLGHGDAQEPLPDVERALQRVAPLHGLPDQGADPHRHGEHAGTGALHDPVRREQQQHPGRPQRVGERQVLDLGGMPEPQRKQLDHGDGAGQAEVCPQVSRRPRHDLGDPDRDGGDAARDHAHHQHERRQRQLRPCPFPSRSRPRPWYGPHDCSVVHRGGWLSAQTAKSDRRAARFRAAERTSPTTFGPPPPGGGPQHQRAARRPERFPR